jgi:AraC-like DNA-binding protein
LTTVSESVVGLVAAAVEENAPVTVPGFSATAPGYPAATPRLSTAAPGLSTAAPGLSTTAPGLSTTAPGLSTTAPGFSAAAKAFIDANVHDPDLTPATVAAALHVSRRTLYRSFAHEDQTIASYIRAARLRRVRRDLDAAAGTLSIGDAAARWGFTNGGYFAKLFHDEFGVAPSQYVRRAGGTELP